MARLVLCLGCAGWTALGGTLVQVFTCQRCALVFCEHGIGWPRKGFELCFACKARAPRVPEDIKDGELREVALTPDEAAAEIERVRPK